MKSKAPDFSGLYLNRATSYSPTECLLQYSSGLRGLTSVFWMGTGGSLSHKVPINWCNGLGKPFGLKVDGLIENCVATYCARYSLWSKAAGQLVAVSHVVHAYITPPYQTGSLQGPSKL